MTRSSKTTNESVSVILADAVTPPTATAIIANDFTDVKQSALALKTLPSADAGIESYISYGRPDLAALLGQVAKTGKLASSEKPDPELTDSAAVVEGVRVAVYAAGPEPLVASVAALCGQFNGLWGRSGRAYLDFHATTHEL